MSQGTRSKVASHSKSGIDSSHEDDHEDVKVSTSYITQSKLTSKDNRGSIQTNPSPITLGESFIIKHNFGPLFPYQQFSNRIFHNTTALWKIRFLAQ